MKTFFLPLAVCAALLVAGCGHLDLQSEGDPERVLTGTINFHAPDPLPAGMEVTVRLIDPAGAPDIMANNSDAGLQPATLTPTPTDPSRLRPPLVLGEQKIENAGSPPVAFRIEYRADDKQLRRGLSLEARVSIGGKLRFYNVNGYGVTLAKAGDPQEVWLNPTGGQ